MKYFAKYLPVEGKVTNDCVAIGESGVTYIIKSINKEDDNGGTARSIKGEYLILNRLKLTKLFLCSRDIQVGDIVTNELGDTREWNKLDESFNDNRLRFKVIGEISPNAVWVKDGDEFDGEDVEEAILHSEQDGYGERASYGFTDMEKRKKRTEELIKVLKERGVYDKYPLICYVVKCQNCNFFH